MITLKEKIQQIKTAEENAKKQHELALKEEIRRREENALEAFDDLIALFNEGPWDEDGVEVEANGRFVVSIFTIYEDTANRLFTNPKIEKMYDLLKFISSDGSIVLRPSDVCFDCIEDDLKYNKVEQTVFDAKKEFNEGYIDQLYYEKMLNGKEVIRVSIRIKE